MTDLERLIAEPEKVLEKLGFAAATCRRRTGNALAAYRYRKNSGGWAQGRPGVLEPVRHVAQFALDDLGN